MAATCRRALRRRVGPALDAEQASAAARQVLSERGLDDWAVQVDQDHFDAIQADLDSGSIEGRVCANL